MAGTNEAFFDKYYEIFGHLTKKSFGLDVTSDAMWLEALRQSLPLMDGMIENASVEKERVNLLFAYKAATKLLGENLVLYKKEDEKRLCFETAFVLLYFLRPECKGLRMGSTGELLKHYPELQEVDDPNELKVLLEFRNMMKVAQEVIPAKQHKNHLIDIVTRICEGRDYKYITGSGATVHTRRRVLIYEREGGITPEPRPPRKNERASRKRKSVENDREQEFDPFPFKQVCYDVAGVTRETARKAPSTSCDEPDFVRSILEPTPQIAALPIPSLLPSKSGPENEIFLNPFIRVEGSSGKAGQTLVRDVSLMRDVSATLKCLEPVARDVSILSALLDDMEEMGMGHGSKGSHGCGLVARESGLDANLGGDWTLAA